MERNSTHGPRIDDALSAETEGLTRGAPVEPRVEEWREKEPFGEDQAPPTLGDAGLELRAELAKRLRASAFPANRQQLEDVATEEQAPGHILDLIRRLPDGRTYGNTQDVWRALGGKTEERS